MSFGYGDDGQLGHGDEERQHTPKLIEALRGKKVLQISAGENHSLVLAEGGAEVLSFGSGLDGQLGRRGGEPRVRSQSHRGAAAPCPL